MAVCCFIIGSTCANKKEADVNESELGILNDFKAHCQGMYYTKLTASFKEKDKY